MVDAEKKKKGEEEGLSLALTAVTTFANGIKPVLVAAFTGVDMATSALKNNAMTGRLVEATEDTVLLPVRTVQRQVDDKLFLWSDFMNADKPIVASLANSHPGQFIASTSVACGLLCALPLRAAGVPAFRVMKVGTLLAVPPVMALTYVVQYKWTHARADVRPDAEAPAAAAAGKK